MRSASVRSRSTATAPPPGIGAAVTSNVRPTAIVFERAEVTTCVARRFLNRGQKIRVANAVDQRRIQPRSAVQQPVHAAIGPLHASVDIDRNHRVLHAVEQRFQFALAGLHARKAFFDAARRLIQRRRHLADLVRRSGRDSAVRSPAATRSANSTIRCRRRPTYCDMPPPPPASRKQTRSATPRTAPRASGRSVISTSGSGYASRTAPPETGAAT